MIRVVFQNPWVQALGVVVGLVLLCLICYLLSPVLVPLFFAFLVAYILDPVVDFFERRKIPRVATIAVLVAIALFLVFTIPFFVVQNVVVEADRLIRVVAQKASGQEMSGWVEAWLDRLPLDDFVRSMGWVGPDVQDFDPIAVIVLRGVEYLKANAVGYLQQYGSHVATAGQQAGAFVTHLFTSLGRGTLSAFLFVGNIALFAVVTVYLLKDFDNLVASIKGLIPPRYRDKACDIFGRIDIQIHEFLRGQLSVCACLALMYATGLLISGTPFAIVIALISGVISFVPYMGPICMFIPASVLTLLQYGADGHVVGVICTLVVVQLLESNVVTPKIVGERVGLNPVWVILALLVFSKVLGFLGLLIAVPTAAALKVLVVDAVAFYKRSSLFEADAGDTRPPDSEE